MSDYGPRLLWRGKHPLEPRYMEQIRREHPHDFVSDPVPEDDGFFTVKAYPQAPWRSVTTSKGDDLVFWPQDDQRGRPVTRWQRVWDHELDPTIPPWRKVGFWLTLVSVATAMAAIILIARA